jgi:hypothetical protein
MDNEPLIFAAEDLFKEIPGDPDNVMLQFPNEVLKITGWKEGDTLDIRVEDGKLIVKKHG